jgi:hypothetical protein
LAFVTCLLRVIGASSPGERSPSARGGHRTSRCVYASLCYLESGRAVIDILDDHASSLEAALGMASRLVRAYGAIVSDFSMSADNDVCFTLKVPIPDPMLAGPES